MLSLLLLMAAGFFHVPTHDVSGDWKGTLAVGAAQLRLKLHVTKNSDGTLTGTMDSVDQGANGIAIDQLSYRDSKLSFAIKAIQASYAGQLNTDGNTISGTWTQGQPLPLDFQRDTAAKADVKPATPSDIDGAWMGTLDTGAIKLRLVFHLKNKSDGLTATVDSPDQGAKDLLVTAVTRNGASLKLEMKQLNGAFEGVIDKDLQSINGTWSQGGGTLPLLLKRVKDSAELQRPRPQNPVKPYPYREQDVTYPNPSAGITLAATFTIPQGKGPFPAVLLITGSGPQDRDEALMGHRPFLVLSDYLTRHGIAVLRADDRGVGKSGGTFSTSTTADFATDAEARLAYLKTRPEADPHKLGLLGHSEGAMIAPMLAARNSDVAFIVMLAGPGVPGDQILLAQEKLIMVAGGMSAEQAESKVSLNREIFTLIRNEPDQALLEKKIREKLGSAIPEAELGQQLETLNSSWFRFFLTYDPAVALRKVTCPVLALNGSKDLQVPLGQNLPAVRAALTEAGNKHFETDEMPGLNHLFQTANTGSPSEYAEIPETIAPPVLKKIADWILANT